MSKTQGMLLCQLGHRKLSTEKPLRNCVRAWQCSKQQQNEKIPNKLILSKN